MREFNDPGLTWDKSNLVITARGIEDWSTSRAKHDYKITLSIAELGRILQVVSDETAKKNPETLRRDLCASVGPLLRIVAISAGLVTLPSAPNRTN